MRPQIQPCRRPAPFIPAACRRRRGLSLLEILAVVTLLGIVALVVIPRFGTQAQDARVRSCQVNKQNVEVQCRLWRRNTGSWPDANLTRIGADTDYFPEGVPNCPVDNRPYRLDTTTGNVIGHAH